MMMMLLTVEMQLVDAALPVKLTASFTVCLIPVPL
jgi:hypothetical protein